MSWFEELSASFPSPRPGEPERLRNDIADELADHLACALAHEQRRVADEAEAKRRVLDRFGDPKAVARKLWWDAMKGVVMKDRIMLGMVVVLALAVLASLGMSWKMYTGSQAVNVALLEQIKGMSGQGEKSDVPSGWVKPIVRVVAGKKGGPPVEGAVIEITEVDLGKGNKSGNLGAITDKTGTANFSPIAVGYVTMDLRKKSPSGWEWQLLQRNVPFGLGSDTFEIVCPEAAAVVPPCSIEFRFENGDLLQRHDLWLACGFEREEDGGEFLDWNIFSPNRERITCPASPIILNATGQYGMAVWYGGWPNGDLMFDSAGSLRLYEGATMLNGRLPMPPQPPWLVLPGEYQLSRLWIVMQVPFTPSKIHKTRMGNSVVETRFVVVEARTYAKDKAPRFTLNPGNNVWTLPLPPESEIEAGLAALRMAPNPQ